MSNKYAPPLIKLPKPPTKAFQPKAVELDKNTQGAYNPMSNSNTSGWALSKFLFEVDLGSNINVSFQACDGLQASVEPYEYRDGNSFEMHKQKRPGTVTYDPITLKKGMFANDTLLYNWFRNVSTGAMFADMRTVIIRLYDTDNGINPKVLYTWTLEKAFVTRYTPSSLDAMAGDEVAIEELEIVCQKWTMF